jgi:alpha-N-arabinofuranosidase
LIEDVYNLADALCVGGMLITLLNNCDRVKIACLAQLMNVIAPIMTRTGGSAWRQTIFYPFAAAAQLGRGIALRQVVDCPTYKAGEQNVPLLASSVILAPDGGLTIFAVNRDLEKPLPLTADLRGFPRMEITDWSVLDGDLKATNTEADPDRVEPRPYNANVTPGHRLSITLPKASWNVIHMHPARA